MRRLRCIFASAKKADAVSSSLGRARPPSPIATARLVGLVTWGLRHANVTAAAPPQCRFQTGILAHLIERIPGGTRENDEITTP